MPKYKKTKEDVERLKLIKQNIKNCVYEIKTLKETIKSLKLERKQIKAKYEVSNVLPEPLV